MPCYILLTNMTVYLKTAHNYVHYPSLINLTVSVDVKNHVYLLTYLLLCACGL